MASGTVYQRATSGGSRAWVAHATWNEGGRRRQTTRTFKTKREAQDALVELLAARRYGTFVEPTRLPLRSYLAQWLPSLVNVGRAPMTVRKAVDAARANRRSWGMIGLVLGVSKQAAHERFGRPARTR